MNEPSKSTGRVPSEHLVVQEGAVRRVRLRTCTAQDRRELVGLWSPLLERGPTSWLDRDWAWDELDSPAQVAFDKNPEFLVLVDEVENDAPRDLLGVLVTTGPVSPSEAGLDMSVTGSEELLWVEYVAIAPSLRPDCPKADRRKIQLKAVGPRLMLVAIERSKEFACSGRVGLHAEGMIAANAYDRWGMQRLTEARHPTGGAFPVFFGNSEWANRFAKEKGTLQ